MNKKIVVALLATLIVTSVHLAEAQQPAKVPRIAFLAGGSRSADSLLLETFWQRMKELGYIEGKNIAAEYGDREFVDAGGLMSYGVNIADCAVAPRLTWTRS